MKMRSAIQKVTILILLGTVLSNGQLPEDDFRIINKQDLLATDSDIFEDKSSKSFSQLLFDVARDQVIVGARDAIYRLSLRGLHLIEKAEWPASDNNATLCQVKGQSEENCHNYIKILLSLGHRLFACGTNAFSPQCSWREIESVSTVLEWVSGVANCPYNPHSNVTALLASTGEYYTGTPTDFAGSDTAIFRSRGANPHSVDMLRTSQYDPYWLNEPQFVGSFEDEQFVYFIFREVAVEFMNCGKIVYSRIARVCKNDDGGHLMMRDKWSTFLKARLNCSVPGDYPFYYDEIQSIEYMDDQKLLVAVFTTPDNSIAGSAVCVYNMTDITAAFDGPYREQDSPTSTWEPRMPSRKAKEQFKCKPESRQHREIQYHNYHLMYDAVQPISGQPIYRATLQRFTHVTVDVTVTNNGKQLVVFVATDQSEIIKLSVLPQFKGACLVELWKLKDRNGEFVVQSMQFVKDTMSVYAGGARGVWRVGAARCARAGCAAADPHCAWDGAADRCVPAAAHAQSRRPLHAPPADRCAGARAPLDGGWSSWSEWEQCAQDNGARHPPHSNEKPDTCLCRTRTCDNPKPANGGQNCSGASIAVANCTVHGGWSAWSAWSECSATCGIAIKSRRRACSAPEPRHGGRVCVGQDSNELYCYNLPPCPDPELAPVDGGWSAWGAWSGCGAEGGPGCGAGAGRRERRRQCAEPAPRRGGADCEGAALDRQPCDLRPCEVRKATAWTPWVRIPSNTSEGSYSEKRFKFLCKAPSSEQIRLTIAKEEDRYCSAGGSCGGSPAPAAGEGAWEAWGAWGACSAPCGGGQQTRRRRCRELACLGAPDMLRACNTQPCAGEWSCWSDWSECSGSCTGDQGSTGHRSRTRQCLSPEGCPDAGAALEKRVCENSCAGDQSERDEFGEWGAWGEWGEWGECAGGSRSRARACARGACGGRGLQRAACGPPHPPHPPHPLHPLHPDVYMSAGSIVACAISAYIVGCLSCLAGVVYCSKRHGNRLPWRRTNKVPSSPHYITAKQNSYVTVPLKDVPRKAKRQPSFTGIVGTSGTLLTKSNNLLNANNHNNTLSTPKLYPKAIANEYDTIGTLRRHSNQPNNKSNIDLEEERFY